MDGCRSSGGCKSSSVTTVAAAGSAAQLRPQEQGQRCPRCDSPNTKFCYYNNYSLSQPRHFCKSCRRYWTKGGALRNVPVGGGCRKTKKTKLPSPSSSSSATSTNSLLGLSGEYPTDHQQHLSYDHLSGRGLKLFGGLSSSGTAGLSRLPSSAQPVPFSGGEYSSLSFSGRHGTGATSMVAGLMTNNYPLSAAAVGIYSSPTAGNHSPTAVSAAVFSSGSKIASSIESLSSINQDLHWKLQQQRLAMLLGSSDEKHCNDNYESNAAAAVVLHPADPLVMEAHHHHHHQPFQLPEHTNAEKAAAAAASTTTLAAASWFMETNNNNVAMSSSTGPVNDNSSSSTNSNNTTTPAGSVGINYWNSSGMTHQAWNVADGIHQFPALP